MRILLFSGKGGVGKTSLAAATGLQTFAARLSHAGDERGPGPQPGRFLRPRDQPVPRQDRRPVCHRRALAIHEVNIQKEIKRHWREISSYVISVLRTTGISDVEAEELAILPGMEELSAMMYVNQFRREERYDVIVLDCAPTAESMRFVSMPTTLEWYMKHIFPFQRGILKAVRPLANRVSPVELPPDSYFGNIQDLFGQTGRDRRTAGRSAGDQRAAGDESGADGAAGNAARLRLLLAARPDGGWSRLSTACCPSEVTDAYFEEWRASQAQDSGRDRSLFRARAGEAGAAVHARSAGTRAAGGAGRDAVRARRKTRRR